MNILIEHGVRVSTVTLDRPNKLNALNGELLFELKSVFDDLRKRPETRCVILTGAGKAFAAGADIAEIANADSEAATNFSMLGKTAFNTIEQFPCPVIAAVNGFALGGGCELALACDFIIASDQAKFGLPEVKLGVVPGYGGMQRLAARVGAALAREMIYTGDIIDAATADKIGLANRVVPGDQLTTSCHDIANKIASVGPVAVAAAKHTLAGLAGGMDVAADLADSEVFGSLFGTADQIEGMQAFIEKREPQFTQSSPSDFQITKR